MSSKFGQISVALKQSHQLKMGKIAPPLVIDRELLKIFLGLFCLKDHCPLGYLFRVGTKMPGESHDAIKKFNPNSFTYGKHAHAIFSDFSRL